MKSSWLTLVIFLFLFSCSKDDKKTESNKTGKRLSSIVINDGDEILKGSLIYNDDNKVIRLDSYVKEAGSNDFVKTDSEIDISYPGNKIKIEDNDGLTIYYTLDNQGNIIRTEFITTIGESEFTRTQEITYEQNMLTSFSESSERGFLAYKNGRLSSYTFQYLQSEPDTWINESKSTLSYDGQGSLVQTFTYEWNGLEEAWQYETREDLYRDNAGCIEVTSFSIDSDDSTIATSEGVYFVCHDENNLLLHEGRNKNGEVFYEYETGTGNARELFITQDFEVNHVQIAYGNNFPNVARMKNSESNILIKSSPILQMLLTD